MHSINPNISSRAHKEMSKGVAFNTQMCNPRLPHHISAQPSAAVAEASVELIMHLTCEWTVQTSSLCHMADLIPHPQLRPYCLKTQHPLHPRLLGENYTNFGFPLCFNVSSRCQRKTNQACHLHFVTVILIIRAI